MYLQKFHKLIPISILLVSLIFSLSEPIATQAQSTQVMVPEGKDYATQVLGTPWDMSDYSQVSQYMNQSGQNIMLEPVSGSGGPFVENGLFSAKTLTTNSSFFMLWPGYQTAMLLGKIGANYPVSSSYHCLYMASKIDSNPTSPSQSPDVFRVFWFGDETLNGSGSSNYGWGLIWVDPQNPQAPAHTWQLRKMDLIQNYNGGAHWDSKSKWEGLRFNPTIQQTTFAFDWVRLTDCNPVNFTIDGLTKGKAYSFYVVNQGREILVDQFTAGGSSYNADLEGIAAGAYTYLVKSGSSVVKQGSLTVNQAPVITFDNPSTTSGEDYTASYGGSPWNMNDPGAISFTHGIKSPVFASGFFSFSTAPYSDSNINLALPKEISAGSDYRYLTFRMFTDGPWEYIPNGTIARWVWRIPNASRSGDCWLVSNDIPYDVGWQTVTVDLKNSFEGTAEQVTGDCANISKSWADDKNITGLRFDPDENQLGHDLYHKVDWFALTKEDQVRQGNMFNIHLQTNKPDSSFNIRLFYTTDPKNSPKQNLIGQVSTLSSGGVSVPNARYHIYMPSLFSNSLIGGNNSGGVSYAWNTGNVSAGEYYICAESNDGYNTSLFCSDAPVRVTP